MIPSIVPHIPRIHATTAICLGAQGVNSCTPAPMIDLSSSMAAHACENTKLELPCPPWNELYEIQGVYSFDYVTPDDELDHGTPDVLVLTPQTHGEYRYGVTIFHISQGHHLADPEMTCHLACELNNGVITVPERASDTLTGKKGPYSLSFKRDAQNHIIGLIVKDANIPGEEIHYRKNIGHRDFK